MFEKAKWICRGEAKQDSPAPYLRKSFSLKKSVQNASLHICGLGTGEYYINACPVTEDVLVTPITKYDSTVIYSTFDVTELLIVGENVFAAVLGNSWYNITQYDEWNYKCAPWCDVPKLIFQLDIIYNDGTTETINSDKSWKTADSPIVFNQVRYGVHYDARMETENWNAVSFDDSIWDDAAICHSPGGKLSDIPYAPIRVIKRLKPVKICGNVYDFGENLSGWLSVKIKGDSGNQVTIRYSERISAPDKIDQYSVNIFIDSNEGHCDKYICKGGEEETFEPRFIYHGFRYAEVSGNCEILSVEACLVHADLTVIGDFECDDEILNWIHQSSRRSTLTNYFSFPTDCPHREQNGWTGDAALSVDQCLYNYEIKVAYKKWLNDIKDAQRPSGEIPGAVPTGGFGYNWGNGPAWDSALIMIPYAIYKYTGDKSAICQMWDAMKKYMKFLESMADSYVIDFGLGDWLHPEDTIACPTQITNTAYYYRFSCVMADCAELIGASALEYLELAKNIKTAFRNKFMKDGKMIFDTQTSVACAIYQKLYEDEEYQAAASHLADLVRAKNYHTDCGVLGNKYIFDALSDYGYADIAYKMVSNPTCPSFAYWKSLGLSTLGEMWDLSVIRHVSYNHHMFSEADNWLYKHIAGIKPLAPGFAEVLIEPSFLPHLSFVKAHTTGVSVEWDNKTVKIISQVSGKLSVDGRLFDFKAGTVEYNRKNGTLIQKV